MTKAQVAAQASMSGAAADSAVNDPVFPSITTALDIGETIMIADFGTFSTKSRTARQGCNPRTSERIAIAASNSPLFKARKTLRAAVN